MTISSNLNSLSAVDANSGWTTIEKRQRIGKPQSKAFLKSDATPIQKRTSSVFHSKVPKTPKTTRSTATKAFSTRDQRDFNKEINRCRDLESAKKLLKTMVNQNIRPDVVTYTSLISKCKKSNNISQAEQFLKEMRSNGIEPDLFAYSSLIAVCATVGNLPKAEQFLKEMRSNGIKLDLFTYNSLMAVCANIGDLSKAEQFLKEMRSNGVKPDPFTYNSLIDVCATVVNLQKAEQFLKEMHSKGIEPDVITYSSLVTICAKIGDLSKAEQFLKEMHSKGIEPNVITYNSVITVCAKVGNLPKAEQFLIDMRSKGIKPDLIAYNSLIDVCAAVGNLPRAEQFLKEMSNKKIAPDTITYNGMIRASHLDIKQVYKYLKIMEDSNIHFDSANFGVLMECCAENEILSKTELALSLFDQMIHRKIEINDIVKYSLFNALICKKHSLIKYSDLFRELFQKQLNESSSSSIIDCHEFSHGAACFFVATRLESLTKENQVTIITGKGLHGKEKNWAIMQDKVKTFLQQNCPLWDLRLTNNEGRLILVKKTVKVN